MTDNIDLILDRDKSLNRMSEKAQELKNSTNMVKNIYINLIIYFYNFLFLV